MIRACSKRLSAAVATAVLLLALPLGARAAVETDPQALYATMRRAYEQGEAHHWRFVDEQLYLSTILDAGRAYALFRPSDAEYGNLAALTVTIATQLHYDPLVSNDAAEWYVREAAKWTIAHGDAGQAAAAQALLSQLQAEDLDLGRPAADAVTDARADAAAFPHDGDALAQAVVADIRAYNLTHDAAYRSLLLKDMTNPDVPLVRVPDPEFGEMFHFVDAAVAGDAGYSDDDRANARIADERRKRTPDLQVIARVHGMPHDERLTRIAPADEYFGNLKMSPLGVHNELARINRYLDAGWGNRMSSDGLNVVDAVIDWQHQYPHDATLPRNLLETYRTLARIDSPQAEAAAARVRNLLLVQYAGSPQARQLSPS
jgi:hypothetical protein